jgi:hypothetical protein
VSDDGGGDEAVIVSAAELGQHLNNALEKHSGGRRLEGPGRIAVPENAQKSLR